MKFEQNRTVQNIQNFEFFLAKMVNHFLESVDAILEEPTCVTRLKFAPNMAVPISISPNEKGLYP